MGARRGPDRREPRRHARWRDHDIDRQRRGWNFDRARRRRPDQRSVLAAGPRPDRLLDRRRRRSRVPPDQCRRTRARTRSTACRPMPSTTPSFRRTGPASSTRRGLMVLVCRAGSTSSTSIPASTEPLMFEGSEGTNEFPYPFSPDGSKLAARAARHRTELRGRRRVRVPTRRRARRRRGTRHPDRSGDAVRRPAVPPPSSRPTGHRSWRSTTHDASTWLLDADGSGGEEVDWNPAGAFNWQRLAP